MYPKHIDGVVPSPNVNLPEMEKIVLGYWERDATFQASVDRRDAGVNGSNEFVFYDGPPFANGLPHYGHLLTGYVKDVVGRYQTQRGHKVERRFGWDTHGLPAELEAMKQLRVKDKKEILGMGISKFNEATRASVMKYSSEWEDYVLRQGRWVDFANDYKTLNVEYMESVLWAFKSLYDLGLTYSGYRVLPYCWRDETPLSNHELRMDDEVYRNRQDPAVTVLFPFRKTLLTDGSPHPLSEVLAGSDPVAAIAWTTTPWTMPSNVALAVGPDIEYAIVPMGPEGNHEGAQANKFLLAVDLLPSYAQDLGYADGTAAETAVISRHTGKQLEGMQYKPLFDYYDDAEKWRTQNAWRILLADYVTVTDGTGIVHQAPAYGEEDQKTCEAAGLPVILSVDDSAKFLPMFGEGLAGIQVFQANKILINRIRAAGRLLRQMTYEHSYPHCWRCRTPLIYRAVESWFVAVSRFTDRMVELNRQIRWIPENVKDGQFGKWLENARDWSISRNRFWGTPIPVWVSDDPEYPRVDVYGSLIELEKAFGRLPRDERGNVDLHRPFIDELVCPNPDDPTGKALMRRVPDVLDVWFDSGSMPYAQVHYPFENKEWFSHHSPADFIVEYIGQTRGWFYLLHVLSTALFGRPAFKNVISHGIVLGSDGQKMSKSLRNYPDVKGVLERDGSDAMRWFLMSSSILRGGNLKVTEEGIREGARQVLLPLWSVYSFFALYVNAAYQGKGYEGGYIDTRRLSSKKLRRLTVLDQFLLAKTGQLVLEMTMHMDAYNISSATSTLREYVDVLTNWYVRRSRQRFFDEDPQAFDVLYTALVTVAQVSAPFLPFTAEEIWRGLTDGRSVHLTDWPDPAIFPKKDALVKTMEITRAICSAGSSLRKTARLRVRLPLPRLVVAVAEPQNLDDEFTDIIASELNVKEVVVENIATIDSGKYGVRNRLAINARAAGPRLGKNVQQAIKASRTGDWSVKLLADGTKRVVASGFELEPHEYTLELEVSRCPGSSREVALLRGGGFIVLSTVTTAELEAEGMARDLIRKIQNARKSAGFSIRDRIMTKIKAGSPLVDRLTSHEKLIVDETLTKELIWDAGGSAMTVDAVEISIERFNIGVFP